RFGRSFYLPPNSASNALFLTTLRYLLIQDWDLDGDGRPETLRLLDAIPSRWLADGAVVAGGEGPSAFREGSVRRESRVARGEILVKAQAPARAVGAWSLRLPDPPGYRITGVRVGDEELKRDAEGRVDLTRRTGEFTVRFQVEPK